MKILLSIIFIFTFSNAFSASLFDESSIINIELKYNIALLQAEKETLRNSKGLAGQLTTSTDSKIYEIRIFPRGKGSFDCQQPQLKLKFNKKRNKQTQFSGIKKIKLFTTGECLKNEYNEEQDKQILANYLIYKLYEEITDYSFKTRLLKIKYIDASNTFPTYEQYGFFLEPKNLLQERLNLEYVETLELKELADKIPSQTNSKLVSIVNGFEFFIANYDYGIPGYFSHIMYDSDGELHSYYEVNSKMFRNSQKEILPIIYDFDISRFSYFGPKCMIGHRFFMEGRTFNPDCTIEGISSNIKADLEKFKYTTDVHKNSDKMLKAFKVWQRKHSKLISTLGPEYLHGLIYFPDAFKKAINETKYSF